MGRFADGEVVIDINEDIRGKDLFIVQSTCPPNINDNLMELMMLISTSRRASARRITAVIPYYGYARQDRKVLRFPFSSRAGVWPRADLGGGRGSSSGSDGRGPRGGGGPALRADPRLLRTARAGR